jgi:uncharacterized protein (TIGR01777 family)
MKVVIPGGTGQVGTVLSRELHRDGHDVVALGRSPKTMPWRTASWDASTLGEWANELDGADVVINLAGRSVNCRYNAENRTSIERSRTGTTRLVGQAIASARRPPRVWLQASTATIYAHRFDAPNDEATGIIGGAEREAPDTWRFSIDVAKSWENSLDDADVPRTRKVKLRSAMTMSPDRGGIFDALLALVRRGLGGTAGSGRQYISWIHENDFVRAVYWLIDNEDVHGVVNLAAPHPLPNAEFMRELREAWGAPFGLPATNWMLELGAVFMRTETELILKSRRVIPGVLLARGFRFEFPTWPEAARDLCRKWLEGKAGRSL